MSIDFIKHQAIIEKFRGVVNKAGFDNKFNAVASRLPKTEKFLLKMELKRLAGPCTRAIDLRGLVDGECQLFDYQGQSHFLDDVAINVFNENVKVYGGYTFGVYEAVKNTENNFRNIYKNESTKVNTSNLNVKVKSGLEKKQYSAQLYQFDNYPDRLEERMNFAVAIEITVAGSKAYQATTVDISKTGLKFRIKEVPVLRVGDDVNITFKGLEQEFHFGKDSLFIYRVENILRDSSTQLIGCKRLDIPEKDGFSQFLQGFIQGNKRRYKVNLDNTIQSIQARSFEQYAMVKLNELPVFVQQQGNALHPRYALTTQNNQNIFQYWQNEKHHSTLNYLINSERIARIIEAQKKGQPLIVYSFINQHQGSDFFYSIDSIQASNDLSFLKEFIGFAAKKTSFAVSLLTIQKVNKEKIYSPFTLSNVSTKQQYLNAPPSKEVVESMASLSNIVVIKEVTNQENIKQYQEFDYQNIDKQKIKRFGHSRSTEKLEINEIGINYRNQRQEPRFKYKTPAEIECQSVIWKGNSEDFSVSGLKVNLTVPAQLTKGDIVYLSFPKLQQITSSFDLKKLPYKVVRINKSKTTINLRVSVKEHQHIGRSFFKLLIAKNKDKLTPDEYAMLTPGLAEALRTSYAVGLDNATLAVQSSGSRYKIESLLLGADYVEQGAESLLAQMKRLSDRKGFYNLYPLLSNLTAITSLETQLKKLMADDLAITETLYVAINPDHESVDKSVTTKLASELNSPELTRFFIKKSLKQGLFFSLQVKLSRTDSPQMEYLNPELSYIGAYAIHRGKQIEQDIWSVAGILEVFDVTQETLMCYKLQEDAPS